MSQPEPGQVIDKLAAELSQLRDERDRLNTRCHELERNRELFQEQRDKAIEEKRFAEAALADVMGATPFAQQIEHIKPEPFSLVIVRADVFDDEPAKKAFQQTMAWLSKRHKDLTFVVTHPDKELSIEGLPEALMRAKGWVRQERVALGPRVLEAAIGAYRSALESALQALQTIGSCNEGALYKRIQELLAHPLPSFSAEVKPPAGGGA